MVETAAYPIEVLQFEWESLPERLLIAPGSVAVWRASLDQSKSCQDKLAQMLSPDEVARAERFRFARDRVRFIVGRGILRILLSRYTNSFPECLQFRYNNAGKPALTESFGGDVLHFNVSHTQETGLYAFTRGREIGVDIEQIQPVAEGEQIGAHFFCAAERDAIQSLADNKKSIAFFNCWTRKEAILKAAGLGLSDQISEVEVTCTPDEPARIVCLPESLSKGAEWSLWALNVGDRYAAAIAVCRRSHSIQA